MKFLTFSAIVFLSSNPANARIRGQQKPRKLQELVGFGAEPDANRFPLQLCQGDCDNDEQCDVGLVCFKRDKGDFVRGCDGGESFMADTDFCVLAAPVDATEQTMAPTLVNTTEAVEQTMAPNFPTTTIAPTDASTTMDPMDGNVMGLPVLQTVGDAAVADMMPLGLCLGDCDTDDDCLDDFICYQREEIEPVPGCYGTGDQSMDYCIRQFMGEVTLTVAPTSAMTQATTSIPLPVLETITSDGSMPLGICQGDCDTDADCLNDLVCYQRDLTEPVPGCQGAGIRSYDYCIVNPFAGATSSPSDVLGVFNGTAEAPSVAPVGTVVGAEQAPSVAPFDEVVVEAAEAPSAGLPALEIMDSKGDKNEKGDKDYKDSEELLGLCQGKCEDDDDCDGDLVCHLREEGDLVPGCEGTAEGNYDYCVLP